MLDWIGLNQMRRDEMNRIGIRSGQADESWSNQIKSSLLAGADKEDTILC